MIPLLLIPGLRCTALLWREQIMTLCGLAPVLVPRAHRNLDDIGAMAAAILDAAPPRFALAGASMGGYIALEMVRQAPDRIDRLALISTSAHPETPDATAARTAALANAKANGMAELARAKADLDLFSRPLPQRLVDIITCMAVETGVARFEQQIAACVGRRDQRPLLPAIACKTLVICGAEDGIIPPDRSRELAKNIAGAELHILSACGHAATLEQPRGVTAAMMNWLLG